MWVSMINAAPGYRLGKRFALDSDENLTSGAPYAPSVALGYVMEVKSGADLGCYIDEFGDRGWCLLYSIPVGATNDAEGHGDDFTMVPHDMLRNPQEVLRARLAVSPAAFPAISRTKPHLKYKAGRGGHVLLSFDYDPGLTRLTEDEIIAQLACVHPGFAAAPVTIVDSSSSYIFVDGKMRKGAGGLRLIFDAVVDYLDPEIGLAEYADRVHNRLILAGYCWPSISERGGLAVKTVVDRSLYNITQPDFLGGVSFADDRITRQRPACRITRANHEPLRLDDISPLTHAENAQLQAAIADIRHRMRPEIDETKARWVEDNTNRRQASSKAAGGTIRSDEEVRRHYAAVAAYDGEIKSIPMDHPIHFDNGIGWKTGHQIMEADPRSWVGKTCADPWEPYYRSPDGKPSRYKGKFILDAGSPCIITFSHGETRRYAFADEYAFSGLLGTRVVEQNLELPPLEAPKLKVPEPGHYQVMARAIPHLPAEQFRQAAEDAVRRKSSTAVAGLPLQRHIAAHWVRSYRRSLIAVPDMRAAVNAKLWLKEVMGATTRVMIMPSRSSPHADYRKTYGPDVFEYWGKDGRVTGVSDDICLMQGKIRGLHSTGLPSVSSHACVHRSEDTGMHYCQRYWQCGFIAREGALDSSQVDFVIRIAGQMVGERNPLLGGKGEPANALLLDLAERPVASHLSTPLSFWQEHPVLTMVLECPEVNIAKETRKPAGFDDAMGEITQRHMLAAIRPETPEAEAKKIASKYRDSVVKPFRVMCVAAKIDKDAIATPLEFAHALDAWFKGEAVIKQRADIVDIFVHRPWRRLDGTPSLFAAASVGRAYGTLDSLKTAKIGERGLDRKIPPSVALSGGCDLPSRVVQVVGGRLGYSMYQVTGSLNGGDRSKTDRILRGKEIRDFGALLGLIVREIGPVALLTADPDSTQEMLNAQEIRGCRVINMFECNLAHMLANPLSAGTRAAFVLGYRRANLPDVLKRVVSAHPEGWPDEIDGLSGGLQQVVSRFLVREGGEIGEVGALEGTLQHRLGSENPVLDETLMSMVSESVEYLANALSELEGRDGISRTLGLLSDHPFAIERANPQGRIILDHMSHWKDVIPSAAWIWTRQGTCKSAADAARRAGVRDRSNFAKDIKNQEQNERATRYWMEPLGFDVDAWLDKLKEG